MFWEWTLLFTVLSAGSERVQARSVGAAPHHLQPLMHNVSHTHQVIQHNSLLNKTSVAPRRHQNYKRKKSAWKTITDTLTQVMLGGNDDYDDSSSSSDSDTESASVSLPHPTKRHPLRSRLKALASSAFAGLAPRIWDRLTSKDKTRPSKKRSRKKRIFRVTTSVPLQSDEVKSEETSINALTAEDTRARPSEDKLGDSGQAMQEEPGEVVMPKMAYKMASRRQDLALIEQAVADSGRRLSFVEYAAILEIMVLTVIAAGVFRTAALPIAVPVFAKV